VAQAITATTPLEDLNPPRPLEELSGRIAKLAPTGSAQLREAAKCP